MTTIGSLSNIYLMYMYIDPRQKWTTRSPHQYSTTVYPTAKLGKWKANGKSFPSSSVSDGMGIFDSSGQCSFPGTCCSNSVSHVCNRLSGDANGIARKP